MSKTCMKCTNCLVAEDKAHPHSDERRGQHVQASVDVLQLDAGRVVHTGGGGLGDLGSFCEEMGRRRVGVRTTDETHPYSHI